MKKFEKTALFVIATSVCLLVLIIAFSSLRPLRVTCENRDCTLVNPDVGLALKFSKAVEADLVNELWKTEPTIQGHWDWQSERYAIWYADTPLPSGTHLDLTLQSGVIGKDGNSLSDEITWTITVRDPLILTIRNIVDVGQEIFSTEVVSGETIQLTFTNGLVSTYAPAPNGEQIIYSVENEAGGSDLWLINRNGSDNNKILDCGKEWCDTPAWSPESQEIAFIRKKAMNDWEGQIWLLDSNNGDTTPLFENWEIANHDLHWSPDGHWLTYWNENQKGIQIVNRNTGDIQLIESFNGDTGCWSADSQNLYFTSTNLGETAFQNVIMKADLEKNTIETIFGGDIDGSGLNYDNPACNNAVDLIALSIQPNTNIPGKELAIYDLNTMIKTSIINDLTRIPCEYMWTPSGDMLIFQQSTLDADQDEIEIWIWDSSIEQAQMILQGARSPAWLP